MSISLTRDRVQVEILRDTSAVSRVGFGVPLFITAETGTGAALETSRALSVANMDEVADLFGTSTTPYLWAQAFFSQSPRPRQMIFGHKAAAESYVQALNAIIEVNDEFFAVAIESVLDADALLMAPAVTALAGLRQFWFRSQDSDIINPLDDTNIGAVLAAANYDQARVVYHSAANTTFPDARQMGRVLPIPETAATGPGSTVWYDQPMVGMAGDTFTSTQRARLEAINVEFFISAASATRSQGGKMAGGEWGEVMHHLAWLETRLAEDMYELMTRAADRRSKIPYNNEGIAQGEATLRNRLDISNAIGGIEADYVVTTVDRADTSFGDRVARTYTGLSFEANLTGAIKFFTIIGTVSA